MLGGDKEWVDGDLTSTHGSDHEILLGLNFNSVNLQTLTHPRGCTQRTLHKHSPLAETPSLLPSSLYFYTLLLPAFPVVPPVSYKFLLTSPTANNLAVIVGSGSGCGCGCVVVVVALVVVAVLAAGL